MEQLVLHQKSTLLDLIFAAIRTQYTSCTKCPCVVFVSFPNGKYASYKVMEAVTASDFF